MSNRRRETSYGPESSLEFVGRKRLDEGQRNGLALSLRLGVEASLNGDARAKYLNLADWTRIYECQGENTIDWPWAGASNIKIPLAATQLDAFVSYLAAAAFGQRFYRVTGLTSDAAEHASLVERYYNAELMRHRSGAPTWYRSHVDQIHLGARDGTGVMEALWRTTKQTQKIAQWNPKVGADGQPELDDDGNHAFERTILDVSVDVYDDVQLQSIPLRNFGLIPAAATSIDTAVAAFKIEYLYEPQLMEMVRAGILDADEVEACLSYVPIGVSELPASNQPLEMYTAGGQVSTGAAQGPQTSEYFKARGPIEVYRIHSSQYDLDNDGQVEENIFWVHRTSWRMLGWMGSPYWAEHRPFFAFSPLPRYDLFWGFSVIERIGPYDQELDAIWNQRNNAINLAVAPPQWRRKGSDADTDENAWRPNTTWYSSSPDDFSWVTPPKVELTSFEQEQSLVAYAEKFLGIGQVAQGMNAGGRKTAAEIRQVAAATSARMNLAVMNFRQNAREIINFIHSLKKQYQVGTKAVVDGKQTLQVPPDILGLDYQIDVWGGDDPTDVATRRTEIMALYDILLKSPMVQQDPSKQYAALEMVLDAFERPDIDRLIGTQEQLQAQAQQQQLQQVLAKVGNGAGVQPFPGAAQGGTSPENATGQLTPMPSANGV